MDIMIYLPVSVRSYIRPSSLFQIDNFYNFCIHILIGDEWYEIINLQNPSIFFFTDLLPLFILETGFWPVIPLLFILSE